MTSPKKRFQEDTATAKWLRDVVDNRKFTIATESALLQLIEKLTGATPPLDPLQAHFQLVGARKVLRELATLSDEAEPIDFVPQSDNLNHRV